MIPDFLGNGPVVVTVRNAEAAVAGESFTKIANDLLKGVNLHAPMRPDAERET